MKAITIHQPWAHAIAHLGKDIENRSWNFSGGELAIHAGKTWDDLAASAIRKLGIELPVEPPLGGHIVAVANVAEVHHSYRCRLECSRWAMPDQYHWFLTDVRALAEPVPCRGAQGIWAVPDDVAEQVRAQLELAPAVSVPAQQEDAR